MENKISWSGLLAMFLLFGMLLVGCDNGMNSNNDNGDDTYTGLDLEKIGFDLDAIYGGSQIPPAPANMDQAMPVFMSIFPAVHGKDGDILFTPIEHYVRSRTDAVYSGEIINFNNKIVDVSDIITTADLIGTGFIKVTGTVKFSASVNPDPMDSYTFNLDYQYDSDTDNSDSYTGKRLFGKFNTVRTVTRTQNSVTGLLETQNSSTTLEMVFADDLYCGIGTSDFFEKRTYTEVPPSMAGNKVLNNAGLSIACYSLDGKQTFKHTFTEDEAKEFFSE